VVASRTGVHLQVPSEGRECTAVRKARIQYQHTPPPPPPLSLLAYIPTCFSMREDRLACL